MFVHVCSNTVVSTQASLLRLTHSSQIHETTMPFQLPFINEILWIKFNKKQKSAQKGPVCPSEQVGVDIRLARDNLPRKRVE